MRLFGKKQKPFKAWENREKYPIKPVFEVAGRTFYAFTDVNNMPSGRALAAIPIYVELRTNADHEYLGHFVAGMEAVLNDPKSINIEKLITLKNQIKDRLSWAYTPDMVFKYASVVYFDDQENPETYDEVYNAEKIEFWKQNAGPHDFFLAEPITSLIPVLRTVNASIPMYSEVILKAQAAQLQYLSDLISSRGNSTAEGTNLSSQILTRSKRLLSEASRFRNTSFSSKSKVNGLKN
jgi:hypothetical protein